MWEDEAGETGPLGGAYLGEAVICGHAGCRGGVGNIPIGLQGLQDQMGMFCLVRSTSQCQSVL